MSPPSSLTTAPVCARPVSPETTTPGRHGRHGPEGLLRRRRSPVQERYPHPKVPPRARYRHQLGRYGEDLAPHLLQRA